MKIDDNMLSIPPYLSTNWSHVRALYVKGNLLVVTLSDGDNVNIPGLDQATLEKIFSTHALYLEKDTPQRIQNIHSNPMKIAPPLAFLQPMSDGNTGESPFRLAFGAFDGLGTAMQHNPAQAQMPDLPPEVLQKVSAIAKIVAPDDVRVLPKAEPHCNCVHCQIARAIQSGLNITEAEVASAEEEVPDAELQFQQWDIKQTGTNLFRVINKLDTKEEYNVYLGEPVGCTCGKAGCDHIVAVLKS